MSKTGWGGKVRVGAMMAELRRRKRKGLGSKGKDLVREKKRKGG